MGHILGFCDGFWQLSWVVREGPVLRGVGRGGGTVERRAAALGHLPWPLSKLLHL